MEAMEKLKSGVRFSEVASQYSEDKARQGVRLSKCILALVMTSLFKVNIYLIYIRYPEHTSLNAKELIHDVKGK